MFMSEPINIAALRERARARLPRPLFEFVDGGAEDEVTLNANRESFRELRVLPRLFTDVSEIDLSATIAGRQLTVPILFSPAGLVGVVHPAGETAPAIVARRHGTLAIVSGHGTYSLEEVAQIQPSPGWFNIFPWGERDRYGAMIDRARSAGFTGLCLTVDTTVAGNRERDIRNGWTAPPRLGSHLHEYAIHPRWVVNLMRHRRCTLRNFAPQPPPLRSFARRASHAAASTIDLISRSFSWEDLEWIRAQWEGPLALKGAFSVRDAIRAAECGIDVLLVGNHGGRQLDGLPSGLEQLALLRDALQGRVDLILDGGVRRGLDIVKAICIGASAVSIGRAWVYGLAAGGVSGVEQALTILERELRTVMALLGARSIRELDASFLLGAGLQLEPHSRRPLQASRCDSP